MIHYWAILNNSRRSGTILESDSPGRGNVVRKPLLVIQSPSAFFLDHLHVLLLSADSAPDGVGCGRSGDGILEDADALLLGRFPDVVQLMALRY